MLRTPDKDLPARIPPLIYDERLQEELKIKMASESTSAPPPFHPVSRVFDNLALAPYLHPLTHLYGSIGSLSAALTAEHFKSCPPAFGTIFPPVSVSSSAFSIDDILNRPGPAAASFMSPRRPAPYFPYHSIPAPSHDILGKFT